MVAGGTFDVMDTCAATQDESDVQASNETAELCPRISDVTLSCRFSHAQPLTSSAVFELIVLNILFFITFKLKYPYM